MSAQLLFNSCHLFLFLQKRHNFQSGFKLVSIQSDCIPQITGLGDLQGGSPNLCDLCSAQIHAAFQTVI